MANISESYGSVFCAPPNSVLLHACNCRGSWGAGVAATFRLKYPDAYVVYRNHCKKRPAGTKAVDHVKGLLGTCLLIPPSEDDNENGGKKEGKEEGKDDTKDNGKVEQGRRPHHYIACLFTSAAYGRGTSDQETILRKTGEAVRDLGRQIEALRKEGMDVGEIWGVRINSGLFGVPWEKTLEVLKDAEVEMKIVRPAEEAEKAAGEQKGNGKRKAAQEKTGSAKGTGKNEGGKGRGGAFGAKKRKGGLDGWLK